MYKIYANDVLIYNDITPELEQTKLIDPRLTLEDNTAGTFTAKIPLGNACYNTIAPITTTIRITRDDMWIWTGRVLSIAKDFWQNKTIECEGALAFLNDTVIPLTKYPSYTLTEYVGAILNEHNAKVPSNRKIYRGSISNVSQSGGAISIKDYYLEGQTSLAALETPVEDWGFHFRIREYGNQLYLDILRDDMLDTTNQQINFGENLLDYSDNYDWSDIVTALLPLGAKLDTIITTGSEDYPDRVTIKSVNSNSLYLINSNAVSLYGRIEQTVDWSDVEDPSMLKQLAQLYLDDFQYNEMVLTVKVVDLHYLNSSVEAFKFLSQVNVVSRPHNLSKTFIISRMEIPFDHPENTAFTFSRSVMGMYGADRNSSSTRGKGTISAASSQITPRDGILKEAKDNATSMISMATNGFVTLVPSSSDPSRTQSLVISNMSDPEMSTRKWTWNVNGLMHQKRSSTGASWESANIAITMDGEIVADMITTGILRGGSGSNVSQWNLNTGVLDIISSGTGTSAQLTSGSLTIKDGNYKSIKIEAGDGYYRWNSVNVGHIGANNLTGQSSVTGLEMGVDENGYYIAFGYKDVTDNKYMSVFEYINRAYTFNSNTFYRDYIYIAARVVSFMNPNNPTVNCYNLRPGWTFSDGTSSAALDDYVEFGNGGYIQFVNGIAYRARHG